MSAQNRARTTPSNPESGLRNHRTHFLREQPSQRGVLEDVRDFLLYSDATNSVEFSPGASIEERRVMSNPDPEEFLRGPESHEVTIAYDLCKWLTQNGGDAWDALYDAILRDADNKLANSHTIVDREDRTLIAASSTYSGTVARPTRTYKVARGALVDEAEVAGDPSDSQPISVELSYIASRFRPFKIDQPTDAEGAVSLYVQSTSDADTMDITIESEGGATSETVALNGTTAQISQSTYSDIDAVELSATPVGDISVGISTDGATADGDVLMPIYGAETYGVDGEGDLGVPTVGADGTRETPDQVPPVETFIGDEIRTDGTPVPHTVQSATLTVANNVEEMERSAGFAMALYANNREIDLETTMFGEKTSYEYLLQHLQNNPVDHTWAMRGGDLILPGLTLDDPGDNTYESEQAVSMTENTHSATGLQVTEAA